MGKSFAGFSPTGPAVVTLDEITDPDDLAIRGWIGDEVLQDSRTKELIFPVPRLVAYLSGICTLYPGDLIFTGTPAGVGMGRTPRRFLRPGETLMTEIEGLGRLEIPLEQGSL
jgi:2-keto-4-pentenoate hydratase/2-oxohepta-3-ene-1,7-dioic acid hydratase in catechol pathway